MKCLLGLLFLVSCAGPQLTFMKEEAPLVKVEKGENRIEIRDAGGLERRGFKEALTKRMIESGNFLVMESPRRGEIVEGILRGKVEGEAKRDLILKGRMSVVEGTSNRNPNMVAVEVRFIYEIVKVKSEEVLYAGTVSGYSERGRDGVRFENPYEEAFREAQAYAIESFMDVFRKRSVFYSFEWKELKDKEKKKAWERVIEEEDWKKAKEMGENFLKEGKEEKEIRYNLALLSLKSGDRERAKGEFELSGIRDERLKKYIEELKK